MHVTRIALQVEYFLTLKKITKIPPTLKLENYDRYFQLNK